MGLLETGEMILVGEDRRKIMISCSVCAFSDLCISICPTVSC